MKKVPTGVVRQQVKIISVLTRTPFTVAKERLLYRSLNKDKTVYCTHLDMVSRTFRDIFSSLAPGGCLFSV